MDLSRHDQQFADLYRGGPDGVRGNAKACYRVMHPRAKPSTAETSGPAILRKSQVRAYLDGQARESAAKADVTEQRVIDQLAHLGFSDVRKLFTASGELRRITDLDEATAAAVASIEVVVKPGGVGEDGERQIEHVHKIKLADKRGPLELLGKYLSLFTDRVNVNHSGLDALLESIAEVASSTPAGRIKARVKGG